MTRQAAPPAHRWLLLIVVLLVAPWLGQGVAAGVTTITVDPPSGGPGTTVNVTLEDFLDSCVVMFDDAVVVVGEGCAATTLSFTVPATAAAGDHEIRAVGQAGEETVEQAAPFQVTGDPAVATTVPVNPSTTAAGGSAPAPSTATCPRGQVALMRFDLQPGRGEPGASISAATTWGSVGTCSEVRPLLVLFDGVPLAGEPPEAGTSGFFRIAVPDGARTGVHRVDLVAADDESVVLSSVAFTVVPGEASIIPIVAGVAAGALLLLAIVQMVRRLRRRRRSYERDFERETPYPLSDYYLTGSVDVPDIAGPGPDTQPSRAPVVETEDDPTMPVVPLVVASGRDASYYLLERQNANAPRTGNGKRGWYRIHRPGLIRGIVVETVEPHTAGAAASEMATGTAPTAAHVVVDADGALELLPDDVVAMHRPELDDGVLVMLLAGFGAAPRTDEMILSHAANWSATKMRTHGIPARRVSVEEFRAGGRGLLSADADFPWHKLVTLVEPPSGQVDLASLLDLAIPTPAGDEGAPRDAPGEADEPTVAAPPVATDLPAEPVGAAIGATDEPDPTESFELVDTPAAADVPAAPDPVAATIAPVEPDASPPPGPTPPDEFEPQTPPTPAITSVPPVPSQPEPPVPTIVSQPVSPMPPVVSHPEPPVPPVVSQPVAPVASQPEPPVPPVVSQPVAPAPQVVSEPVVPQPPVPPVVPQPEPPVPLVVSQPPVPPVVSQPEPAVPPVMSPPGPPVPPVVPQPPAAAAPPPPRRRRLPLPTPDDLIARVSGPTDYYLLDHENLHGTLRANGKHGWYYPTRYGGIRAVVLHRLGGPEIDTAEGVAAHLATVDGPEAAHAVVDPDTIIDLLPDETTALHGARSSSAALDLALAYDPAAWGTDPATEEALLVRAAAWAGVRAVRHRIPVRRITVDEWHSGQRGFAAHGDIDPGADFPWPRFLQLTGWVARRVAANQPPAPDSSVTDPSATDPSGTVRSGIPPT